MITYLALSLAVVTAAQGITLYRVRARLSAVTSRVNLLTRATIAGADRPAAGGDF
jgi:hypothetical protein